MPSWLGLLLGLVVLVILILLFARKRSGTEDDAESALRECKVCKKTIPSDYSKSLCPHCNVFLT